MKLTDSQLKDYLLGKSGEQAEEEIGEQIIADEDFEEKLLIAENDLLEDFLDKNLSPEDEGLFFENFLVCEERRQNLEEINFSRQVSKKHLQNETPIVKGNPESFRERIKETFGFNLRFAVPVFAVLVMAVVGFYFFYPSQLSPLEKEYAELNRRDFSKINEFADFSNVSLVSGTYRDSVAEKTLEAKNLSNKIFFRLALPFNLPENETLEAEIIQDQKTVFRQTEIRVYQNANGREVRLFLPREIFSKGKYRIKIENPRSPELPFIYDFALE